MSTAASSAASSAAPAPARITSTPRWAVVWEMSDVSEATSTAPPPAGPLSAIGAANSRNGRPSSSMFSNPVAPETRAARASLSSGSSPAPSVSERARIRPCASITSTAIDRPDTGVSSAPGAFSTAGAETASSATSCARWRSAAVERAAQLVADEQHGGDAEQHERDENRSGRREDEPEPQRLWPAEPHSGSLAPCDF